MIIRNHRRSTNSRYTCIGYRGNIRRWWSRIRYRVILRRCSRIRCRGVLRTRIGIDACGGICIRFKDSTSRRIGRYGSGNCWIRYRGNSNMMIDMDSSGFWKNFRGDSSSSGCWNRCRLNRNIMIGRDNSRRVSRDDISCCHFKYRCIGWEIK